MCVTLALSLHTLYLILSPYLTSVCGIECCKGNHKEGCRVFSSIDQMWEGSLRVTVTPQALNEAEPGRQTLDNSTQAVRIAVAGVFFRL